MLHAFVVQKSSRWSNVFQAIAANAQLRSTADNPVLTFRVEYFFGCIFSMLDTARQDCDVVRLSPAVYSVE